MPFLRPIFLREIAVERGHARAAVENHRRVVAVDPAVEDDAVFAEQLERDRRPAHSGRRSPRASRSAPRRGRGRAPQQLRFQAGQGRFWLWRFMLFPFISVLNCDDELSQNNNEVKGMVSSDIGRTAKRLRWACGSSGRASSRPISPARLGLGAGGEVGVRAHSSASEAGTPMIVADITILLLSVAFYQLSKMLGAIAEGDLFSARAVGAFRAFAFWLLLVAILSGSSRRSRPSSSPARAILIAWSSSSSCATS